MLIQRFIGLTALLLLLCANTVIASQKCGTLKADSECVFGMMPSIPDPGETEVEVVSDDEWSSDFASVSSIRAIWGAPATTVLLDETVTGPSDAASTVYIEWRMPPALQTRGQNDWVNAEIQIEKDGVVVARGTNSFLQQFSSLGGLRHYRGTWGEMQQGKRSFPLQAGASSRFRIVLVHTASSGNRNRNSLTHTVPPIVTGSGVAARSEDQCPTAKGQETLIPDCGVFVSMSLFPR